MKYIVIKLLVLFMIMPNLHAQSRVEKKMQDFYKGSISIDSITGVIKIRKDKKPDLNFVVNISGKKDADEVVSFGFREVELIKAMKKHSKLAQVI